MNDASSAGIRPLNKFLKMAVMAGVESAVRIHIDRGDDLNACDGNGQTLLMLLAARNKFAMCKLLLDAGADKSLVSPSGKTAHDIAVAAGAHEAAALLVLNAPPVDESDLLPFGKTPSIGSDISSGDHMPEDFAYPIVVSAAAVEMAGDAAQVCMEELQEPENSLDIDLIGWEPEEDCLPPEVDPFVTQVASAIQVAISEYEPVDSSIGWEDIEAYLPEMALSAVYRGDAEARERLRLFLLRAAREGSVPGMKVDELSTNDDRSANPTAKAWITMVVNDLGAEVDERFEYVGRDENWEVFVKPEETSDEEEIVNDALAFFDGLARHQSEPLHLYLKDFQRHRLISAAEEVSLCKAMENGLERALDALAAWPRGMELTLVAGQLVKSGQRPLAWLSLGPAEPQPEIDPALDGEGDVDLVLSEQSGDDVEPDDDSQSNADPQLGDHASDFLQALDHLSSLPISSISHGANWHAVRETLLSLRLNQRFLMDLADVKEQDSSDSAIQFFTAMREYRLAREQMTTANLKLVFHIAKKYLFSGEPLDDLAQEGNIGLLKAVERFDWRRGYKFSTYATWWIRQQIGRHIPDRCRMIRIPVHVYDKIQRLFKESRAFESETGRMPDLGEISRRMNMSARAVLALQSINSDVLPIHEISVDEEIAVDARFGFFLPDPFDVVAASEMRGRISDTLSTLKPMEERVLRLRFGIGISDSLTLEEVGQRFCVTRERIRQIEASAIRKLQKRRMVSELSRAYCGNSFSKDQKEAEENPEPEIIEQIHTAEQISPVVEPISPVLEPIPQAVGQITHVVTATIHHGPSVEALGAMPIRLPAKSGSFDRLLAQAKDLGIPFDDNRKEASGEIWVYITDGHDKRYHQIVRKLLALGFEFWPGKGYWR